jgi:hypothetical protein
VEKQEIVIRQHVVLSSFTKSTNIYPFNAKEVVSGIAVSGNVTFNSDTSFVRIIVDNGNNNVYMIYEIYPMLITKKTFDFEYEAEETNFLNGYSPIELQIQLRDAYVNITKISLNT